MHDSNFAYIEACAFNSGDFNRGNVSTDIYNMLRSSGMEWIKSVGIRRA